MKFKHGRTVCKGGRISAVAIIALERTMLTTVVRVSQEDRPAPQN